MKFGPVLKFLFFGNYFYGICAVALAIEATLQQLYPLNGPGFYVAMFSVTVWYYTQAYITEQSVVSSNQRTNWYITNKTFVKKSQRVFMMICVLLLAAYFFHHEQVVFQITGTQVFLVLLFPVIAMLYYGVNLQRSTSINLRQVGWLKPFIIGFVWAGLVTIYPVLFYQITNATGESINLTGFLLFIKNFMFVAVLGMMFDIKDYATDSNHQLKTFVVHNGLRKTIFYILIPLSIAGLGSFLIFATIRHFSIMRIILNTIPFLLMLTLAYSLHRRKSILFYLGLVDGLMLIKALCGTLAISFF